MAVRQGQLPSRTVIRSVDMVPADYDQSASWETLSGDQTQWFYPLQLMQGEAWYGALKNAPAKASLRLRTRQVPLPVFSAGGRGRTFTDLFYGRLQLNPSYLNLGNILNSQSRDVELWNATFQEVTVAGVTATDSEGVELTGLTFPKVLKPLEAVIVTVGVSTQGPVQMDARYLFDALGIGDVSLQVVGTRVVVFSLAPDTSKEYTERMEWISDVITSQDGTEQRTSVVEQPDTSISYTVQNHSQAIHYLDSLLWGWQHRIYAVPMWHRAERLTEVAYVGSSTLMLDTTYAGFRANGLVMMWSSYDAFEAAEIAEVRADRLILKRGLQSTWGRGASATPCRAGRLPQEVQTSWTHANLGSATLNFWLTDVEEEEAQDSILTYRGNKVMMIAPNWVESMAERQVRNLDVFETSTKARFTLLRNEVPYIVRGFSWFLKSKANIAQFRSWLYARRGRTVPFWCPSWKADITVAFRIEQGSTSLRIKPIGYSSLYVNKVGRQDLAIFLHGGQVLLRRIISAGEGDDGYETLGLDAEFSSTIELSSIKMVSYLGLHRLDADAVEMSWKSDKLTLCQQNMRLLTDGV